MTSQEQIHHQIFLIYTKLIHYFHKNGEFKKLFLDYEDQPYRYHYFCRDVAIAINTMRRDVEYNVFLAENPIDFDALFTHLIDKAVRELGESRAFDSKGTTEYTLKFVLGDLYRGPGY